MLKEKLQQLQHLKREVKQLERQIRHLESLKPEKIKMEADSVQASMNEFPYTSYTLKIQGMAKSKRAYQLDRLRRQMKKKQQECLNEIAELHGYINSIENSETRQILRMRYVEGLTLRQIGHEMGYEFSAIGKKIKKVLN